MPAKWLSLQLQRRQKEIKSGGGGGGWAKKRGCTAVAIMRNIFLQTQFALVRKCSRSILCTVFYPKESLGNLRSPAGEAC